MITEAVSLSSFLDDLHNLRSIRQAFQIWVQMDLTPAFRKGDLLVRCQVLIANTDHTMVQQRLANLGEPGLSYLAQIDTGNLGAD